MEEEILPKRIKVLVIEDSEEDLRTIKRYLKSFKKIHFLVFSESTLLKSLHYLEGNCPDIILADLNLPDSDGLETLAKIKERMPQIPVIVVTGSADEEFAIRSVALGAATYIVKDEINSNSLVRSILLTYENKRLKYLLDEEQLKSIQSAKFSLLGQMSSGIAHEIANPLSVILGRVHIISRKYKDDDYLSEETSKIEKMINRISKIIVTMRNFSRNTTDDDFDKVSLDDIIQDTYELCQEKIKSHSIHFEIDNKFPGLEIECRGIEISQVLLNLLKNACDAIIHKDERCVKVTIEELLDSITISVTDNGHGVPEELSRKIMEPFFTTKSVGKGTGIGLSISKSIIEKHCGSLSLKKESSLTEFIIELPKKQKTVTPTQKVV